MIFVVPHELNKSCQVLLKKLAQRNDVFTGIEATPVHPWDVLVMYQFALANKWESRDTTM